MIARQRVQVFKFILDSRYAGLYSVSSDDGREVDANPVDSSSEIVRLTRSDTELVAVDEAQLLDPGIVQVATQLAAQGKHVILAGTDTDFRGETFGPMGDLMAVAERVDNSRRSAWSAATSPAAISGWWTAGPPVTTHPRS